MPRLNPQKHLAPTETKLLIGGRKGQVRERKIAVLAAVFQRDPGDFVRDLGNLEAQFVQKTTDDAREL
ncbi:hypothetical protein [Tabrizicola sp. TH137]|uniref:hypothetical protein n=1 Tax=Tabrizicola sp. TH137 TaxID=2067452 RepID=UPI00117DB6D7|nr:hypothetical protein [Tabrizicola sp. TH137]